ncbi:MAG: hypothetical protein IT376_18505 [Polyangiaceae bacterium]|nr:hypothetical protein [Polyangiaceae bacterium]
MRRQLLALGLRVLAVGGALGALAAGVIVLTDEAYSTTGMRAARLAAVLPGVASAAVWIGLERSRALGELRALEALGVRPSVARFGAVAAGWALGAVGVVALLVAGDPSALFPAVTSGEPWRLTAGALVEPWGRVSLSEAGQLTLGAAGGAPPPPAAGPGRAAALAVIGPLAVLGPAWCAAALGNRARLGGAALSIALALLALHAVAAGRAPVVALGLAALPLAAQLMFAAAPPRAAR